MGTAYALAFAALTAMIFSLAYGEADEIGVKFRRYLKLHRAAWADVRRAEWGEIWDLNYLTLQIQKQTGANVAARFTVINTGWQFWKAYIRGEPPEIVSWVMGRVSIPPRCWQLTCNKDCTNVQARCR